MFYGRSRWRCSSKSLMPGEFISKRNLCSLLLSMHKESPSSDVHRRSYFILKLKINLKTLTARLHFSKTWTRKESKQTILDKKELRISPADFWNSFEAVSSCFSANVKLIKLILSGKMFLATFAIFHLEFLAQYLWSR